MAAEASPKAEASADGERGAPAGYGRFAGKLAGFLPLALLVIALNWIVDPAHLFRPGQVEQQIARINLTGGDVAFNGNYDERMVQKLILLDGSKRLQAMVLGSSRSMQVSSSDMAPCGFYNASVSNATLHDFLSIYELVARAGSPPRVLMINLDPFTLKRDHNTGKRGTLSDYYTLALERLGATEVAPGELDLGLQRWVELVSPAYLQASVQALLDDDIGGGTQPQRLDGEATDAQVRFVDGSREYAGKRLRRDPADRRKLARAWGARDRTFRVDDELEQLFSRFVRAVQAQSVDVMLVLFPYHPAAYPEMLRFPGSAVIEDIEGEYREMAERLAVPLIGSFNAQRAGMSEEDFVDGMHATRAATSRFLSQHVAARDLQGRCEERPS